MYTCYNSNINSSLHGFPDRLLCDQMKRPRPLIIGIIVAVLALAGFAGASFAELKGLFNPQNQDRYILESAFLKQTPPLLADGKETALISIRVKDTRTNRLKPLDIVLRPAEDLPAGQWKSEKRTDDYLVTYTPPDLRPTGQTSAMMTLYVFFPDDQGKRIAKSLEIALTNGETMLLNKSGFRSQSVHASFAGPSHYLKIKTSLTDGTLVPVNGVAVTLPNGQTYFSDAEGLVLIDNPRPITDDDIGETTVNLQPDEAVTANRRKASRYYQALANESQQITDTTIAEFIERFEEFLARTKTSTEAERLVAGLAQTSDLLFILNRGSVAADRLASANGKAARYQLWESLDFIEQSAKKAETVALYAGKDADDEEKRQHAAELKGVVDAFPREMLEIIGNLAGGALASQAPRLDAQLANGFFGRVADLASARGSGTIIWDDSWFEKAVIDYFREYYHDESEILLAQLAESIRQGVFPDAYQKELMDEQKSLYEDATAKYLKTSSLPTDPLIAADELKGPPTRNQIASAAEAYDDLIKTSEQAYRLIKERLYADKLLAAELFAFETLLIQTRAAAETVMLQQKDSVSNNLLIMPPAFADGSTLPDKTMQKVSVYHTSLIESALYASLSRIGDLVEKLDNSPSNDIAISLAETESKAAEAIKRSSALSRDIPEALKDRFVFPEFDPPPPRADTSRLWIFCVLLAIGLTYVLAPMFWRWKNPLPTAVEPVRPETIPSEQDELKQ